MIIMDILLSMLFILTCLFYCIYQGIFIGYPLFICYLVFVVLVWKRGYDWRAITRMSYEGGKKTFIVLKIFVLIGAITAIWMASGTVPGIVYYGLKFINPHFFILYIFLITLFVSFLLGTSFGTVSTIGVALIVMAKSSNINIAAATGAILSGAYFGDRCSPMSSSANLIANLTETDLYSNIKKMFTTGIIPLIISCFIYLVISLQQPLECVQSNISQEILRVFSISWIVLLPALIMLLLVAFKVDVKKSMLVSILLASLISITVQRCTLKEVMNYIFFGFNLNVVSFLQDIIKGGGIISMGKVAIIVFVSCALAGIIEGTEMLESVENLFKKAKSRYHIFISTIIVSIVTAALGCNQSIAIVMTSQFMKKLYQERNIDKYELAVDVENTSVVLSALIPWNIAALVPTTMLMVSATDFIPYAFYLYLIPLCNVIYYKLFSHRSGHGGISHGGF